jgi:hypothetical protein
MKKEKKEKIRNVLEIPKKEDTQLNCVLLPKFLKLNVRLYLK